MTAQKPERRQQPKPQPVDVARFDLSLIAGRDITLFTEQFPGKPLRTRVELATERELTVWRESGKGPLGNLASGQRVVVQVGYKGQDLNMPAVLKPADTGGYRLQLGSRVMPLRRREFTRIDYAAAVKMAVMSATTFRRARLSRLRWRRCAGHLKPGRTAAPALAFGWAPRRSIIPSR